MGESLNTKPSTLLQESSATGGTDTQTRAMGYIIVYMSVYIYIYRYVYIYIYT